MPVEPAKLYSVTLPFGERSTVTRFATVWPCVQLRFETTGAVANGSTDHPDPEVPERARGPRRYAASYNARNLAEYDALPKAEKEALPRREGLYASLLSA